MTDDIAELMRANLFEVFDQRDSAQRRAANRAHLCRRRALDRRRRDYRARRAGR
jgi:hypothetical protein